MGRFIKETFKDLNIVGILLVLILGIIALVGSVSAIYLYIDYVLRLFI